MCRATMTARRPGRRSPPRAERGAGGTATPHDYVLCPDEDHGFSKVADSVDFLNRVDAFLGRYNPAG